LDEPLIWQKSGDDDLYRGWWTVVKSDVLMRMPFDGDSKQGLTTLEITRVLAGRSNPHVELLQWVNAWVVEAMEGDDEWEINPIDLMPSEIKELCDLQGTDRKVFVSVQWFWDEGDEPRFNLVEQY
jgi:murein endopeptidase